MHGVGWILLELDLGVVLGYLPALYEVKDD
jgi:hypothetical protein